MIFLAWLRCLRIADGATQAIQAVPVEPLLGPLIGLSGTQVATPLPAHQVTEPSHHVPVDLAELYGGVPGSKVIAPAAQDRIQIRDHVADVRSRPAPHCLAWRVDEDFVVREHVCLVWRKSVWP